VGFGYGATGGPPQNAVYLSAEWTRENVSSRGPLGAMYRVWGDGKQMVKGDRTDYFGLTGFTADELRRMAYYVWTPPGPKGAFIGEGDTPTFLNFIDIGLRAPEKRILGRLGWPPTTTECGGRSRLSGGRRTRSEHSCRTGLPRIRIWLGACWKYCERSSGKRQLCWSWVRRDSRPWRRRRPRRCSANPRRCD
jgi:hypothetical protein